MRSLIFVVVLILTSLTSSSSDGQVWNEDNKIYLEYTAGYGMAPCAWNTGLHTVPVILRRPFNPSFDGGGGRYVDRVSGFECRIEFFGDVQLLGVRYPVPSINAGTGNEYVVGYSEPINTDFFETVLAEIDILIGVPGTKSMPQAVGASGPIDCSYYTGRLLLSPTFRASVTGKMAYLDADDPDDPLVGAARYPEDTRADLWVQPRPVAETGNAWGSVKAIFR